MIKLIVGTKGSGKTKTIIDMINNAGYQRQCCRSGKGHEAHHRDFSRGTSG